MATLVVRRLERELVVALKVQAASRNRSMEEHVRRLLREVALGPRRQPLAVTLMGVPRGAAAWPRARDE